MSEASPTLRPKLALADLGGLHRKLITAGLICLAASLGWSLFNKEQFAFSYLTAFFFCMTICAGSLFWVMLHHAINARWTVVVRRVLEQVAGLIPFMVLLFIPILMFRETIYSWMKLAPGQDVLLDHKAVYLDNGLFFWGRTLFYFLFLSCAALFFRRHSIAQDASGDPRLSLKMRYTANWCIPLFALTLTFLGVDYLMALDCHWFSTMWGVYIFAGSIWSAMAVLILVSNWLWKIGCLQGVMTLEHNHVMGKLLFAFTVFWAYIAFSQYMLIYYANIPEETTFFFTRTAGTWTWYVKALILGHFFIPFVLLLTQPAKRTAKRLCWAAGWILVMHFADMHWIIVPQMRANMLKQGVETFQGFALHPLDLLTWIGLICLLGGVLLVRLSKNAVFPVRDPHLPESVAIKN